MLVHDLFERSRCRYPARIAVTWLEREWSYERLGHFADAVATCLAREGQAGKRVGIWMRRKPETIGALLGVLKAGGCVVPLDPDAPLLRVAGLVLDADLRALIVDADCAGKLRELADEAPSLELLLATERIRVPEGVRGVCVLDELARPVALPPRVTDVDLAQVLYTSGSTGKPKGVMLTHRNILDFVTWAQGEFAFTVDDAVLQVTPLFFDISICDLHASFAVGATVHIASDRELFEPSALVRLVERRRVTFWFSVPRLVSWLVTTGMLRPGIFPSLRAVLFGGEPLPPKHLAAWFAAVPGALYANMYGPTETTVASTFKVFREPPQDLCVPLSLGKPRGNAKVLILSERDRLCGPGEEGEICIGGTGVMAGYLGRPDLTERALVQNPLHCEYEDRFYRTGDFGMWDARGEITFKGRRDAQVKIGGVRSELAEIEAALASHPAINEAVVVVRQDTPDQPTIVGCYTTSVELDEAALWEHLAVRLPRVMLPRRLERLEQMPRLPNGKVDRLRCRAG